MCAEFKVVPKRILIIDDDIDLLMLLERRLQREGFTTETAASLSEGQEIIESFSPHLILLDINVRGEDGRQLCWRLKHDQLETPVKVVLMSGYDYSTSRAVLFGADDLLLKPLNADYLLHRLSLQLYEAEQEYRFPAVEF